MRTEEVKISQETFTDGVQLQLTLEKQVMQGTCSGVQTCVAQGSAVFSIRGWEYSHEEGDLSCSRVNHMYNYIQRVQFHVPSMKQIDQSDFNC